MNTTDTVLADTAINGSYAALGVPHPVSVGDTPKGISIFADLDQFKVDMKEAGLDGAEEQLAVVSVRKPPAEEFIRVNPDRAMTITVALHDCRDNFTSEYYIVAPRMLSEMMDLRAAFYAQLCVTVTRSGLVMLWPVKLPTGGASNPWYDSALRGAEMAKTDWIRIYADPGQKQYRIRKALGAFDPPAFPDKPLNELLELAFRGRIIDTSDHPICKKLRGEA
ncbi:hypothetical protein [Bradyrhizobium septentrionale]|uniref:Uncharacterized protein n=1 Tax=Bradyrhizobium septentrionale TaxID=1404411 RepID=A0ABZ2NZW4_9BRAD